MIASFLDETTADLFRERNTRAARKIPRVVWRAAQRKLKAKNCDLIVANDVSCAATGMDSDENELVIFFQDGVKIACAKPARNSEAPCPGFAISPSPKKLRL